MKYPLKVFPFYIHLRPTTKIEFVHVNLIETNWLKKNKKTFAFASQILSKIFKWNEN